MRYLRTGSIQIIPYRCNNAYPVSIAQGVSGFALVRQLNIYCDCDCDCEKGNDYDYDYDYDNDNEKGKGKGKGKGKDCTWAVPTGKAVHRALLAATYRQMAPPALCRGGGEPERCCVGKFNHAPIIEGRPYRPGRFYEPDR